MSIFKVNNPSGDSANQGESDNTDTGSGDALPNRLTRKGFALERKVRVGTGQPETVTDTTIRENLK